MNVWFNLPTIIKQRYALLLAGLLTLFVALTTTLLFANVSLAAPGINEKMSFQGRLLTSSGGLVPDGRYNMQFKIYQGGSGSTAGNPDGDLSWSENYVNNNANEGVVIKNGYFSVDLGSKTAFGSSIDWNDDTLWLSINIAGSAAACTAFGTAPCMADGEMLPMKRLTSTPYALNAAKVGGKSSDQLAQLGQGVQVDNSSNSSLFINKLGVGNLMQLQNTGSDVFTVTNSGDILLGSNANHTIAAATSANDLAGTDLSITAGTGGAGSGTDGGNLIITGGAAGGTNGSGGDIVIAGGTGSGTGVGGLVILSTPTFSTTINDANCYTDGQPVASSCTITSTSIDSKSGVITGFSAAGQTATLPDPTNNTAGRVVYIMAAPSSEEFTLSANSGATTVTMRPNTTTTMMWNGSDWSIAGTASSSTLHDVYSNETNSSNATIGNNSDSSTSLLTLDKGVSAPSLSDPALLGSMYYDTTLGEVQCFEESGWGNCGASPDSFITLSPEYSNAVMNGADIGTISSDLCSDTLNINDANNGEEICGTNETYNFYKWTSSESSTQTRSIYVTYQLPTNFKEFVAGSTSLKGRTSSSDASVSYQVYRDSDTGLESCSVEIPVSTGAQTSWQQALADNTDDPATCGFVAGDSILFRINLSAHNNGDAYVSNLNFTFSNN